MFDLVIRGGTVIDGHGTPGVTADIAVEGGRIVEVGRVSGAARETVDAGGLLVTPGWVDVHTHYDGQVSWDSRLEPSIWHGVSTVVFGNCGVGFAPVRPDRRDWLIQMMEGVEDIPGTALSDGIRWAWETFPDYLDAIDRGGFAMDIGAQMAHGPLRAYVMGERGACNEPATPDDIAEMARLVEQAQRAGALGFSTSRTVVHRALDGEPVPGTFAAVEELRALAAAVSRSGHGVMEVAPAGLLGEDLVSPAKEIAWMNAVSAETGCPITFLTGQNHVQPAWWREQLEECGRQRAAGAMVVPQMFCRAIGIMVSLESRLHPFIHSAAYRSLMDRPYAARVAALAGDADLRLRVAMEGVNDVLGGTTGFSQWKGVYALGSPADYEPRREDSVRAIARREGRDPREIALDILLAGGGTGFLHRPVMGYADGNLDSTHDLLASPLTVPGGSDGGAHVATICDAGAPTFLMSYWARDRTRGPRLPVEHLVRKQTYDSARLYGLADRGRIAVGLKADINLIDFDAIGSGPLTLQHDLPTGAPRLMQKGHGYVATYVSGVCVTRDGDDTGARAGTLIRGGR